MTEQKRKMITEMVMKMKGLDVEDVRLIKVGVDVLSAKEAMESANNESRVNDRKLA